MAIAYGLTEAWIDAVVADESDLAFRAARGNFTLVCVHGKGGGIPCYACWTRSSADSTFLSYDTLLFGNSTRMKPSSTTAERSMPPNNVSRVGRATIFL